MSTAAADERETVLVVDDDPGHLESVLRILEREGLRVLSAPSGENALETLRNEEIRVVVTDLMMPGMSGVALLRAAKAIAPHVEVVLMTAYGTVEAAVEAMKEGADDFLTKPLRRHQLVRTVKKALEKYRLLEENRRLREKVAQLSKVGGLVGSSPAFRSAMETVRQAAASNATILLLGESGTGKELVARAIHELSPRASGPFVPIDCAAIPESLLESELFGHEAGAFTGATRRKEGRFEKADRGTLFLDEVGEMSPAVQAKLLRAIQEGEFVRVGGTQPVRVDVRIVAATNRDLQQEVREGRFREDLYYRLHVVQIRLPPLRERHGDVPLLAAHFLRRFSEENRREFEGFSPEALRALEAYSWPGNVRELENAIERAVVLARGSRIELEDLPETVREAVRQEGATPSDRAIVIPFGTPMEEIERRVIEETLRRTGGDKALAARILGVSTRTIYRKIDRTR
ncbi:MAG: sigma-54 dependent transcriptional regulator [Pseudomonadota bacterium]|nr:MAG: DNA-binding response regulator [Pseudomonadota bacterium]